MAESLEPVLMLYQPLPLLYLVSSIASPVKPDELYFQIFTGFDNSKHEL